MKNRDTKKIFPVKNDKQAENLLSKLVSTQRAEKDITAKDVYGEEQTIPKGTILQVYYIVNSANSSFLDYRRMFVQRERTKTLYFPTDYRGVEQSQLEDETNMMKSGGMVFSKKDLLFRFPPKEYTKEVSENGNITFINKSKKKNKFTFREKSKNQFILKKDGFSWAWRMKDGGLVERKYRILSPDGFDIAFDKTYTIDEILPAFEEFKNRFKKQGYYSTGNRERIDLDDLQDYCTIVEYDESEEEFGKGGYISEVQKKLKDLGVKYEMSKTDKVRPFKVIYKPINKSDEFYRKFDDIVYFANLEGVVKSSNEMATGGGVENSQEVLSLYWELKMNEDKSKITLNDVIKSHYFSDLKEDYENKGYDFNNSDLQKAIELYNNNKYNTGESFEYEYEDEYARYVKNKEKKGYNVITLEHPDLIKTILITNKMATGGGVGKVMYKVAGRPVTLNKGKKTDGSDWTVTFENGKSTPLADVLALIKPMPNGIKMMATGGGVEAELNKITVYKTKFPTTTSLKNAILSIDRDLFGEQRYNLNMKEQSFREDNEGKFEIEVYVKPGLSYSNNNNLLKQILSKKLSNNFVVHEVKDKNANLNLKEIVLSKKSKMATGGEVTETDIQKLGGHYSSYYKGFSAGTKSEGYVELLNEEDVKNWITDKLGNVVKSVKLLELGKTYPYNRDNPYSHDFYLVTLKNGIEFTLVRAYGRPNWSGNVDWTENISVKDVKTQKKMATGGEVESFIDDFILDDIDWDNIRRKSDLMKNAKEIVVSNLSEYGITKFEDLSKGQQDKVKQIVDEEWNAYQSDENSEEDYYATGGGVESKLKGAAITAKNRLKIAYLRAKGYFQDTSDKSKYKVIERRDKHYNEIGIAMNGVEKDKKGKSFVTLTFKKGVSTYGIDEVEEIYDTGGSMMTHGGNTKTGYINDRDSMYHGKNCFVCSHNGPEMMVEIMLKGKMKKIPLNAEKFEPIKTYEEGGAVKIVNKNIKFDKARYKGIFGDFDKDGVVNIDDAYPTNKKKKNTVEPVELAPIIEKLITLKNKLDNSMYKAVDELKEKSPKTANIYARTKTPYSIIKKLIDKRLLDEKKGLTDLIGTTIAVDSYQELIDLKKKIESGLLGTVVSVDDFYSNPNAGYMAYHYIIKTDEGYMVEVQLKTKRMKALNEISHEFYKKGNLDGDNFLEITKLTHYADMGDEEYIKKYDYLMKRKSLLRMLLTGEKKINLKSEKLIG